MHLESNLELQKFVMSGLAMKYLLPIKTPEWSAHPPALAAAEPRQAGRQLARVQRKPAVRRCAFTLVSNCSAHCILDDFAVLGSL